MAERLATVSGVPDFFKWLAAIALLAGAIVAFYVFGDESLLLRVIGLLVVAGVSVAILLQTDKGRVAWSFVREARTEVRKVVWPTRKETVQTTAIVLVMVTIVAIILWILDGILAWFMRWLLGVGG